MKRILVSMAAGALMGLFMVSVTFAALSLMRPGWLRTLVSPDSLPDQATQVAVIESGALEHSQVPLPTDDPSSPPTATPEPLPTVPSECGGPQSMTIALLGVDTRANSYQYQSRTDAITLVRINFANPSAAMLSIPRDLYVSVPNLETLNIHQTRINTAYLYGEIYDVPGGGPAEFKQTIELNFGIRVDRYVMVNFAAFKAAVDAMGGIEVDVPKAIYDPAFPADGDNGTFVFEVPAGRQTMDGETVLRYVRTRHQDDDYRRVQRQQEVLLAIFDKLISREILPHVPALAAALKDFGRTDLSAGEIAALLCLGPKIDRAAIKALPIDGTMVMPWTTPGGGRVSIPNRKTIAPLVEEFLSVGDKLAEAEHSSAVP